MGEVGGAVLSLIGAVESRLEHTRRPTPDAIDFYPCTRFKVLLLQSNPRLGNPQNSDDITSHISYQIVSTSHSSATTFQLVQELLYMCLLCE